ncbi:MAG: alpha/beta hydrolase [Ilumatobacteraceae bacterium]
MTDLTDLTDSPDEASTTTVDPSFDAFQWDRVGVGPVEEGILDVPLDYDDPDGDQISLYVVRRRAPAATRIGSLLVNPGGPGFGGSFLAEIAQNVYGEELLASFDIIGWDPRGTEESEPFIDCVDAYDPYFGIETGPDDPEAEAQLQEAARQFAAGCAERSGDALNHISTVDAARDMDAIRAALNEDEISYFGASYGTRLGATWATLFPETVRAAVLDAALDPTTGRVQGLIDQAAGFRRTLSLFLADCAANPTCSFHNGGDPEGAFAALVASLEQNPIPTAEGRPPLVDGVFEVGVAEALYAESQWPQLAESLAAAQRGDGTGLLALYDQYYVRQPDGTYGNNLEAYFAITCADDPAVGGVETAVAQRPQFVAASTVGYTQAYELVVCASLPGQPVEPFEITGAGAGPIMVVGNTGDPATPYEGSRLMAETLEDGFFVSVEAATHGAYGLNDCIDSAIETYLVDLTIPEGELTC